MPELQVFFVYGLQATGLVFGTIFAVNLILAPARIEKDKRVEIEKRFGVGDAVVRPDSNLANALNLILERDISLSFDQACQRLTDLVSSGQVSSWGRKGNFGYSYPIDATEIEKLAVVDEKISLLYSAKYLKSSPLHKLEVKFWENHYIMHSYSFGASHVSLLDKG